MDLSHMSDDDLQKLASGDAGHDRVVAGMSDEQLHDIVSGKHEPKYNATQSAVMHGLNQATGGFSDELQGLGEAAGRVVGVEGAGGPMKDMHFSEPTHDWETLKDAYHRARDHERAVLKQQSDEHPAASAVGDVAGMVASPLNKVAKGMSLAKGGAILGGINSLGNSEAEDAGGMAKDTAIGAGLGFGLGKVADKATPYIEKGIGALGTKAGQKAESLAVNATGATGLQSSKFSDDAGRELLDRGLVKFGDSPANVANRVGGVMNNASADIDAGLKGLDAKGVTASADNVVAKLNEKIAELRKDPSQAGIVKKLEGIVDDIVSTGESNIPISQAEKTKRGFSKMAGNWMDPEASQAGKQAYLNYMDEVERAGKAADPSLASKFTEGKKTYGLLAPIEEAATKRANTLNQSPWGGLGDMAAAATGGASAGPGGAIASVVGKKILAPRLTSSAAVSLDGVSKMLMRSKQFSDLAQRNPQAFSALASNFAKKLAPQNAISKVAGPEQQPVDDEAAKKSFVDGN